MSQQQTANVAVVAVHGVGEHQPGATARAIEQLLLRVPADTGESRYAPFHEEALDIPYRPLKPDGPRRKRKRLLEFLNFDERLPNLQGRAQGGQAALSPPDKRLMDALLAAYQSAPTDSVYESTRFVGQRFENGRPATNVHVYEMYWSDISAIGNRFWSVFGDLYQLIVHLPYIGLQTIDFALEEEAVTRDSVGWKLLRWAYVRALRAFTGLIPTFNLLMLALCLTLLALRAIPPAAQQWLVAIGPPFAVSCGLLYMLLRAKRRVPNWMPFVPVVVVLGSALGALLAWSWIGAPTVLPKLVVVESWVALAVPLHLTLRKFDENRPGVYAIGVVSFAYVTTVLLYYLFAAVAEPRELTSLMYTFEWTYVALFGSWLVYATCATGSIVLGWLAGKTPTLRRAAYTARLTLALPLIVFTAATLLTWGAIYHGAAEKLLPTYGSYDARFCYPALEMLPPEIGSPQSGIGAPDSRCAVHVPPSGFAQAFEGPSASKLAVYSLFLVLIAMLLVLWVVGPSVWAELSPPQSNGTRQSAQLGTWLTSGLRVAWVAGELTSIALVLTWLASILVIPRWHTWGDYPYLTAARAWIGGTHFATLHFGGLLVASGSALGLLALSKKFATVGLGLKPALASAIDVDVYLRELPHTRTPRARMVERYTSLLRYLCLWRAPTPSHTPRGYDAIVIVAHSQGTVLTADLLRYLKQMLDAPAVPGTEAVQRTLWDARHRPDGVPVLFLSLGCPLHQLYARRFPHLYGWAAGPVLAARSDNPRVHELRGVTSWVNLYRSGDYVGRALWRGEGAAAYRRRASAAMGNSRAESCLGEGAHTHYWDATASKVGAELDALIASVGIVGSSGSPPARSPTANIRP